MPHAALPDDGEINGVLAVMLLIHARCDARTAPDGTSGSCPQHPVPDPRAGNETPDRPP